MVASERGMNMEQKRGREDEQVSGTDRRRKSQRVVHRNSEEEQQDEAVVHTTDNSTTAEEANETELRPHTQTQRLGTDTKLSFDKLANALEFSNVLVVPEAVVNALDACSRDASVATSCAVPVLRALGEQSSENEHLKLVPESHESQLFALFGNADAVACLTGWQSKHVRPAQAAVEKIADRCITAEVVHNGVQSEVCAARGIAAHPANNTNVAGGKHPTLKHLQSLVRYLSRRGFDVHSIISACKQKHKQRSSTESSEFKNAKEDLRQEPQSMLVTTGGKEHFENYFGRRLRQSEAVFSLEHAAGYTVGKCHTVQCFGLEALVAECQRRGVPCCGTALLSSRDLDAVCNTLPSEAVPLHHQPAKALNAVRASLRIANSVMGAQVPLEQIPKVARSAVDATINRSCVPIADVLEHNSGLLEAVRSAAASLGLADDDNSTAWQMVQQLSPLQYESNHCTLEGMIQAAAAHDTLPNSTSGSVSTFWQCMAQVLPWGRKNAHLVCMLAQHLKPHDADVQKLPEEATNAVQLAAFWRVVALVVSEDSVQTIKDAAHIIADTETHSGATSTAVAIRDTGFTHAFASSDIIQALVTDDCASFVREIATLGTHVELDMGKAAQVMDTAGLWCSSNSISDTMRSRASRSRKLPLRVCSLKEQ